MLTFAELKAEVDNTYKDRTLQDWKDASAYRGITQRSQKDFDKLCPMYVKKIGNIREMLRGNWSAVLIPIINDAVKTAAELGAELAEQLQFFLDKESRLIDKFAACLKEVQMRENCDVVRTDLHDQADYYIDYDNGNDGSDGLSTGNAWKTITKYTTTTVRTAGDVAYLRANITWDQGTEAVNILFDEDGDVDNYISIIGCDSVTNDPWGDADDTLPIIDFEDASYNCLLSSDNYWWIERVVIEQSDDPNGSFQNSGSYHVYFKSCVFRNQNGAGVPGLYLNGCSGVIIDDCSFYDNNGDSIEHTNANAIITNCTFNGGVDVGTNTGIIVNGGTLYITNTTFGVTTAHDSRDLYTRYGAQVYLRNCTLAGNINIGLRSDIYSEDDSQTFEVHLTRRNEGTITRDTGTTRVGGADSSAKMEPGANCGPNSPLILGSPFSGFARVWATKDVQINLSVYAAVGSAWDSALTAAECYAKFSYLSNAANATRTEVNSTEQIANDGTFDNPFTSGNFTPLQTGWVYVWVYLEEYEDATEHIFVDIKPVVS